MKISQLAVLSIFRYVLELFPFLHHPLLVFGQSFNVSILALGLPVAEWCAESRVSMEYWP